MSEVLKRCPCCRGVALMVLYNGEKPHQAQVECLTCGLSTPKYADKGREKAKETAAYFWNKRAETNDIAALQADNERLRAESERLRQRESELLLKLVNYRDWYSEDAEEIEALQADLATMTADLAAMDQHNIGLARTCASLEEDLDRRNTDLAAMTAERDAAIQEAQNWRDGTIIVKLSDAEQERDAAQRRAEAAQNDLYIVASCLTCDLQGRGCIECDECKYGTGIPVDDDHWEWRGPTATASSTPQPPSQPTQPPPQAAKTAEPAE